MKTSTPAFCLWISLVMMIVLMRSDPDFIVFADELLFDIPEDIPYPKYVERRVIGYPQNPYWGDTFYLKVDQKNITNEPFVVHESIVVPFTPPHVFVVFTSDVTPYEYNYSPASALFVEVLSGTVETQINPGYSYSVCYPIELPSREAQSHPFWEEIEKKMTPEGIACKVTIILTDNFVRFPERYYQFSNKDRHFYSMSKSIVLKPRPESEAKLFHNWRDTILPQKPRIVTNKLEIDHRGKEWYTALPQFYDSNHHLLNEEIFQVFLDHRPYDIFEFTRLTISRPPMVSLPRDIGEWRYLENSLVPSTFRDEVQWVRMQLEYYGAKNEVECSKIRDELVKWFRSLPESQRTAFASTLISSQFRSNEKYDEFFCRRKYALIETFYYEMTSETQWRFFKVHPKLTPPWGVQEGYTRVFCEILDPPSKYVELRQKCKEDNEGLRLWKFGIYYLIAKNEGKTESEDIILKNTFGFTMSVPIVEFDSYDLSY